MDKQIAVKVIREKRKTMVLKLIDAENAQVKAPLSFSDKKIGDFIKSKENWLVKMSQKMRADKMFSQTFDLFNYVYVDGKPAMKAEEIAIGFSKLPLATQKKLLKKHYLTMFSSLEQLARELSEKTGLIFKEIKPVDSIRVWGSYSNKKQMKLNWKLILLPRELKEYIIYHELSHSLYMNHKPQFWALVEKCCPNYKELKKKVNQYSFVLKTVF